MTGIEKISKNEVVAPYTFNRKPSPLGLLIIALPKSSIAAALLTSENLLGKAFESTEPEVAEFISFSKIFPRQETR
jgi:hypothetical protein